MPTPTELRAEIESGPLAAELATPWAAGNDTAVAAALNRQDRAGYVPARHVVASLSSDADGFGASLIWAWTHGALADGTALNPTQKVLLARLFFGADNPEYAIKYPPADLVTGCTVLGAPVALQEAILAGEVKVSRAEELGWGDVSATQIGEARNG
jgi:hypothetical protein